ncbi:hypothetical protein PPYR_08321 [Photinus pyralis]|uniref:Large ribosomal subunit protein uL29m n=1 Tax=Photinus pyralis TaxID=7054 RepID=A0A1Y1MAJ6_PHOPY|nr:39S ribosomal protein L47, mitochondrial [Photinus pyralis]KAB0797327.1 hypothetical protein PPYR_08321 [Photinus pyralis]
MFLNSICNHFRTSHRYVNGTLKERIRHVSTSPVMSGLMEFFDDEKNWGSSEVKTGRSWTKDDLRIKSNTDLHKLWYVLVKEKNMLLSMEHEHNEQVRLFPSPERLDKVLDSMENLEEVVRERNRAYYELETTELGEQPHKTVTGPFGLPVDYHETEHSIPKEVNAQWQKEQNVKCRPEDVKAFLLKYKEREYLENRRRQRRDFNHVIGLLNRFPKMDMEALKEQYPDVDIEKAKASRKYKPPVVFD